MNERKADNKVSVTYVKGNLVLQGETYRKKVTVPKPSELIAIDPEDLERILHIPVARGQDVVIKKSIFIPYAIKARTFKQIRECYKKIKLVQPEARHVVCAYRLKGEPEYFNTDYCDDEEPGAG